MADGMGDVRHQTGTKLSHAEVIELAVQYAREIADLADRMDADGDRFSNRGTWLKAVWLLREDVRERLKVLIGERVLAAQEELAARAEVDAAP